MGVEKCLDHWSEGHASYLTLVASLLLCLITAPNNLLLCVTVLKDPHKKLRSSFIFLVLNSTIAGLIVGSVTEPLSLALALIKEPPSSTAAVIAPIAQLRNATFFIASTVCLMTIICLCVDRYLAISAPDWYKADFSFGRPSLAAGFVWIIGVGLPMTCLTIGFQKYAFINANMTMLGILSFVAFSLFTFHWDWDECDVQGSSSERITSSQNDFNRVFYSIIGLYLACQVPASIMMHIAYLAETMSCEAIQYLEEVHFILILMYSAALPCVCIFSLPQLKSEVLIVVKCAHDPRIRPHHPSTGQEWDMAVMP